MWRRRLTIAADLTRITRRGYTFRLGQESATMPPQNSEQIAQMMSTTEKSSISTASVSVSTGSGCVFDLATLEQEIAALDAQSAEPGFWDDARAAQAQMRRLGDAQ